MSRHLHHGALPPHTFLVVVVTAAITVVLLFWAPSAGAEVAIGLCGQQV